MLVSGWGKRTGDKQMSGSAIMRGGAGTGSIPIYTRGTPLKCTRDDYVGHFMIYLFFVMICFTAQRES